MLEYKSTNKTECQTERKRIMSNWNFFISKIAFEIVSEPVSFMGLPQFNHFVQIVYVHVLMEHCDVIKQLNVDLQF